MNSGGMRFFKPTWSKVIYAGIFTLFPYVLAFILVGSPNTSNAWGAAFFQLIVLIANPLFWLTFSLLPYDDDFFLFYVNPLLSFLVWYLISCTIVFLTTKLKKQNTH